MFKPEPNDTKNRPLELPYLLRDTETTLITRYCPDLGDAEWHANRLNKVYYPQSVVASVSTAPAPASDPEPPSQFTLF